MKTRIFALAPVALVALLAACSSSTSPTETKGEQDRGVEGTGGPSAASAPDTNPDGVPYPTENIGREKRNGSTPGSRITNYKFLAYPDGDISKGLQPISMATFFDPKGVKNKLIHIQASGSWCVYCVEETKVVAPIRHKLLDRKVVWIISLAEGKTPGTAATTGDLDKWISQYKAPYIHFFDPGNRNLGEFYDAAALPWNANIDARTMEILDSHTGAITSEAGILADLDKWLSQIDSGQIK
jgi:hypothetical protein